MKKAYLISLMLLGMTQVMASPSWYGSYGFGFNLAGNPKAMSANLNGNSAPANSYLINNHQQPTFILFGAGKNFTLASKWFSHFSLGLDFNSTGSSTQTSGDILQYGLPSFNTYTYQFNTKRNTLLFNYQGDICSINHWTPFVSVGVGLSQNTASGYSETERADITPRVNTFSNKTISMLAYQLGLGVGYQFDTNLRVDTAFNYGNPGKAKLGNNQRGIAGPQQSLAYSALMLNVRYQFNL